jgi:23S rRNA (cytosine1962-C5)-methyltransferase
VDDCEKFLKRELRRGNHYDAVLLDPPSFGRGPDGELWKIEDDLFPLVSLIKQVLSDNPLFVLLNSYTTGLQPTVAGNILSLCLGKGSVETYELCLPTEEGITLPSGCSAFWEAE